MAATDYTQAVREALAGYLRAQLIAAYPALVVYPEWPEGDKQAKFSIYIGSSGDGDFEWYPPKVISTTPDVSPATTGTVIFTYGRCNMLPLEIDAWSSSQFDRDNFARDISLALFTPPSVTLMTGAVDLPTEADLIIPMPGMFNQPGRFNFNPTGVPEENSDGAEKYEWRSHWRGNAEFSLIAQKTGFPLIKQIRLLIGAGEKTLYSNPREERDAKGVTLRSNPASLALTRPTAARLQLVATFQGGMTADVTKLCAFATDAPRVASVDASGRVLAGNLAGTAHLTVSYAGATASVTVTVS